MKKKCPKTMKRRQKTDCTRSGELEIRLDERLLLTRLPPLYSERRLLRFLSAVQRCLAAGGPMTKRIESVGIDSLKRLLPRRAATSFSLTSSLGTFPSPDGVTRVKIHRE